MSKGAMVPFTFLSSDCTGREVEKGGTSGLPEGEVPIERWVYFVHEGRSCVRCMRDRVRKSSRCCCAATAPAPAPNRTGAGDGDEGEADAAGKGEVRGARF